MNKSELVEKLAERAKITKKRAELVVNLVFDQMAQALKRGERIEIRGNAETWWSGAKGIYERGHDPEVGAVMVFSGTRKLPMGHVAVVSEIVSDREIRIDHANWKRNQVSLGMAVIDVSEQGDWSAVKVAYDPGKYGRVYPISGFIYPQPLPGAMMAGAETAEDATVVVSTSGAL